MNKLVLITLALILNIKTLNAKTYNVTLKVFSLATQEALEGFIVYSVKDDVKVELGKTDNKGELLIPSIKEKTIQFLIEDPKKIYLKESVFLLNYTKKDEVKEVYLRFNSKYEEEYFKRIDETYKECSGLIVEQIPTGKAPNSENDTLDFIPATPKDGPPAFYRFISEHIQYPEDCIENSISGKVHLSFIVQVDGTISNVIIEKGVHKSLDAEAIRVIMYSPKWIPATSNGQAVRARVKTAVNFSITN